MSKKLIYVGASVGGVAGSILGSKIDGGNIFGLWGIALSTLGGILGIVLAYKIQQ